MNDGEKVVAGAWAGRPGDDIANCANSVDAWECATIASSPILHSDV